jgi:two-component system KDP operon response regulator KdpE
VITAVWGPDAQVDAQFVRVLVAQLRQKLELEPSSPRLVLTEPGVGYRLKAEDDA